MLAPLHAEWGCPCRVPIKYEEVQSDKLENSRQVSPFFDLLKLTRNRMLGVVPIDEQGSV